MSHKHFEGTKINYLKKENGRFFFFFAKMKFRKFDKVKYFRGTDFYKFNKNLILRVVRKSQYLNPC